jgi:ELWxxDGT repeat protein
LFGSTLVVPDFTDLGPKALYSGYDTHGHINLWATDGTAAGTSELTVAGANSHGLFYGGGSPLFTVLGGKALFAGVDTSLHVNLWVTDGSSAGTSKLIPAGANPAGLLVDGPSNQLGLLHPAFTVVGSRVVFEGADASGRNNLWVTDGTSAGTSELTVVGANSSGLFAGSGAPTYISALGSRALFKGSDAGVRSTLWITDGTSAGTSELTDSRANPVVLGPNPAFTILNNKALFTAVDGSLWVTDGTAADTTQLTPSGLFLNNGTYLSPQSIVLGTKALFDGFDAQGHIDLWVTDGTSAGTSGLTVAGAYSGGLFLSVAPDFTVVGGEVLFSGLDTSDHPNLWVTDGTSAGTSEVTVAGAYSGGLSPSDITVLSAGTSTSASSSTDFNGDSDSDILWQNNSGQVAIWLMNGAAPFSEVLVGANPGPSWQVVGAGDFNGDHDADILWQNTNGQAAVWLMNSTTPFSEVTVGANPGPSWQVIGAGDFNGDGDADILWQNTNGQAAIWLMNGTTPFSEPLVGANPGPSWHIVGAGDFNGDGDADILWQNTNGQAAIWLMNGTTPFSEPLVGTNPGPSWHIVGTGDFNGDGDADILWQNSNGQAAIWLMNGTTPFSEVTVGANPGPSWQIVGAGDYNGDGKADILWQNDNGQASIWLMNGTTPTAEVLVGTNPGPTWHIR